MDRFTEHRYWFVEFYNQGGDLEHNDCISSFSELCFLAQGRIFIITGPATEEDYREAVEAQAS